MSVDYHVDFMFHEKLILFYSLLEGFRTSFQIFHTTSYGILHMVEFFKLSLFSNLFFENPYHLRADGWAIMLMYALY